MAKKIMYKIFGFFDLVKEFLFNWGLKILLVLFVLVILHNVLKMSEISSRYTGDYKHLVPVYEEEGKMMNIYSVGEGSKTIVILPGFGSPSPEIQYKEIVDGLKDEYKVVVVEYFGYGFSMSMTKERSNKNITSEVKTALESAGCAGPYIFMADDQSNIYAMYFEKEYPELVDSIISINGMYPEEINYDYYLSKNKADITNIKITSIFELTGYERILSYVSPKTFYIDKMKEKTDIYGSEEISVYRNRIGSQYLSRTMVREAKKLIDNMTEMSDYKYPESLPVLEILSKDKTNEYKEYKNDGAEVDLEELASNVLTNDSIQTVQVIEGDNDLELSNPTKIIELTRTFLNQY